MRQGHDLFLLVFTLGPHRELHVDGIRMADRNAGLEPPELPLPRAPERVGAGLEAAKFFRHLLQISRWSYGGKTERIPSRYRRREAGKPASYDDVHDWFGCTSTWGRGWVRGNPPHPRG